MNFFLKLGTEYPLALEFSKKGQMFRAKFTAPHRTSQELMVKTYLYFNRTQKNFMTVIGYTYEEKEERLEYRKKAHNN